MLGGATGCLGFTRGPGKRTQYTVLYETSVDRIGKFFQFVHGIRHVMPRFIKEPKEPRRDEAEIGRNACGQQEFWLKIREHGRCAVSLLFPASLIIGFER